MPETGPVPPGSDWFPIRITSVLGGGAYLFVEVWATTGGVVADKIGGRINTATSPAYAIDGSTFAATAAGSAVQVNARMAPGTGGVQWELEAVGASISSTLAFGYGGLSGIVASGFPGTGWVWPSGSGPGLEILSLTSGLYEVSASVQVLVGDTGSSIRGYFAFTQSVDAGSTWTDLVPFGYGPAYQTAWLISANGAPAFTISGTGVGSRIIESLVPIMIGVKVLFFGFGSYAVQPGDPNGLVDFGAPIWMKALKLR